MRLPLYPAWLSFAAGHGLTAAKAARAAAAALSIPAGFFIADELAGPWAGALAACALVFPGLTAGLADLTLEPFYGWTLALLVLALARWRRLGRRSDALCAAAAFGLAAATRSTILPALPAAALLASWGLGARETLRRGLILAAAAAALAIGPWALRNRVVLGEALPFEGAGSALGAWSAAAGCDNTVSDFVDVNQVSDEARDDLRRGRGLDDARRASVVLGAARRRAARAPKAFLAGVLRRLPRLWARDWPWLAGGLAALATPVGGAAAGLALLPAATLSLHALGAVSPRYAWPAVPALAALLCAGAVALARRKKKEKPAPLEREAGLFLTACLLLLGAAWARGTLALWSEFRGGPAPEVPAAWASRAAQWRDLKLGQDRGVDLTLAGDWEGARKAFDAVLAREPDFAETLVSRGLLLDRIGSPEDAGRDLARARGLIESR
jgi:tetratricopeptide (TPR) repeat protein